MDYGPDHTGRARPSRFIARATLGGIFCVRPNERAHPAFGAALRAARGAGVRLLALSCDVTGASITIAAPAVVQFEWTLRGIRRLKNGRLTVAVFNCRHSLLIEAG